MEAYTISSLVIIGIVNRIKSEVKIPSLILFLVALILGAAFGYLKWFGLSGIEQGFISGLVSSGGFTLVKSIGTGGPPTGQPTI